MADPRDHGEFDNHHDDGNSDGQIEVRDEERQGVAETADGVQAFCRRIVDLGFISYLDFATTFNSKASEIERQGWGATEVWLCSRGRFKKLMPLTKDVLDQIKHVVWDSNERADAMLGPMK